MNRGPVVDVTVQLGDYPGERERRFRLPLDRYRIRDASDVQDDSTIIAMMLHAELVHAGMQAKKKQKFRRDLAEDVGRMVTREVLRILEGEDARASAEREPGHG